MDVEKIPTTIYEIRTTNDAQTDPFGKKGQFEVGGEIMWRMVAVLVLMGLCVHTAAALPGSGTQQDPWRIQSLADFDEFAADPNYWSGFTRLETDVNLAGRTYSTTVIAPDVNNSNWYFDGTPFTGVFDGNDHKIVWLTIDDGGAVNCYLGLFGYIEDGEVRNLRLEGGSLSGESAVGGLVGWNEGSISNCYSTGDVNGYGCVGGLVGSNCKGSIVSNCFSTSNVNGGERVGGLVGENYYGSISNCYSTGDVNGYNYIGGLVGISNGSVSNCYSIGDVSGDYEVGGLCGDNGGTVSNCYSTGDVSGTDWDVGGLVGANGGSISDCHSTGDVNGDGEVGGLVGLNYSSVSNCYSTGDVIGTGSDVGGLVGFNYGSVSNCYSTGDVNGDWDVGGLVGLNGCRSIGPIPGYIFKSYSTGSVQGASNVGGLIGYHFVGDIEGSFWDVQTSGEPNMCGEQGEYASGCDPNCGKTTAQMQARSTFTDAGWDFIEIWGIGENQTYPYLRFAPAGDFNYDKKVDLLDLAILADHWLEGRGN
jgi:hypothetical protein